MIEGETKRVKLAKRAPATPDRKVVVAYFPAGATGALAVRPVLEGEATFRRFNPRTGRDEPPGGPTPKDGEDWVVVIRRR